MTNKGERSRSFFVILTLYNIALTVKGNETDVKNASLEIVAYSIHSSHLSQAWDGKTSSNFISLRLLFTNK